ncbi:BREX system Lon protease-like protein BrxL [Candidatus Geothermarchaeota archaeon]|nr:MAG: BREX system Lon protease-like protein BrxL [Candidatus Geothermarchaeota archaeon]
MSDIFNKVKSVFGDLATDKRVANRQELFMLPRYVVEYLSSYFIERYGEDKYSQKLSEFISKFYHEARERDKVLSDLMQLGKITIIDEVKVETDVKLGTYRAHLQRLNLRDCMIDLNVVEKHENLLIVGMWGLVDLTYAPESVPIDKQGRPLMTPVLITGFTPFQCSVTDVRLFQEARDFFTFEEWLDVLMNTIGLNHERYSLRQKLVFLTRLIPLVEGNVNLMEFGPKETGKTYLYRNVSYYTRIFSGGNVSPAVLFYNIARRSLGELAIKDAVIFDEITRVRFTNPSEMIGKLADYMESGHFERGPRRDVSTCSLIFMGNIKVEAGEEGYTPVEEFTYVLPDDMRKHDPAKIISRVHGLIPGWILPKISMTTLHLSRGYGIASDYFCEVMHKIRMLNYQHIIDQEVELIGDYKIRDERAVKKIATGLLKLLIPNGSFNRSELKAIMNIAVEYRNRINDLLHILSPGEFPKKKLEYRIR